MFNSKVPSSSTAEGGVHSSLPDLNEAFVENEAGESNVAFAIGEEERANSKKRKVEATILIGQAQADYAKKHCKEAEAEFQKTVESLREMVANFCTDMLTLMDKLAKQPPCKGPEIIDPPPAAFKPSSSTSEGGVKPSLPDLNEAFVENEAGESNVAFAIGEEDKANSKKRKVEATSGGEGPKDIMPTFPAIP
ncbi:uncharacterized protein LOC133740379 [Rosa rugosa]|uniref:uncharacterized protein LOC133740379 n=1 Tax=Rosa rugosa TaxID=74645 RepID=UPI002B4027A6|nr:uncharacterized protein LOC133740379 [Rosa rugosa]